MSVCSLQQFLVWESVTTVSRTVLVLRYIYHCSCCNQKQMV